MDDGINATNNTVLSPCPRLCGADRDSYPLLLSRARKSRSVIRVKTPFIAGVYTENTSLLHDMEAAIAAAGGLWINFIDKTPPSKDTRSRTELQFNK